MAREEAKRAVGKKPGIWIVTNETRSGREHHAILARTADGRIFEHGGCYKPERAAHYARIHATRYGLPVVDDEAARSVRRALAS